MSRRIFSLWPLVSYLKILRKKKSRIRETKNLLTNVGSSNDTQKILLKRQNPQLIWFFFWRGDFTPFMSKSCLIWDHFFQLLFPKDSKNLKSLDIELLELGGKKMFIQSEEKNKKFVKTFFCRGDFTPFLSKSFQIWDQFLPLLFPKDFENLKSLDTGFWEVRAKRLLNGVRNTDTKKNPAQ